MSSVVLFIPHLGVGGAELQLCLLAPRLPAAGWQPVVATMEDLHGIAPRLTGAGVAVEFLPRAGRSGADTIVALARLARRRRSRVIHAWLWASNWRAAIAGLLVPHARVVASIRSMEDDLSAANLIAYRALSPLFAAIIVNSRAVLERSASRTGMAREKYRMVRNGVELDRLSGDARHPAPLPWDPERHPVVGYVGTLNARKRAASLAPLASRILARVPAARFLIVGDGPERAALTAACARLGISDRFHFAGPTDRVGAFLARMSVLIHPSANEGASNSILEAMAAGLPVVAYAVSGNRETVVHGTTGFLANDEDEEALSGAVVNLLGDPAAALRQGAAGRERILKDYSVDAMVRATAAVYDEVVSKR